MTSNFEIQWDRYIVWLSLVYVWKLNQTVLELDFWAVNFFSSLDGIWIHTIDTLQHQSLSRMSSALDHSTTSAPYKFNFQTYIIFSINLVSQVTLRSSGTDILYCCYLLWCLYNILYFLWLYNEFFIILYNIFKNITVLDCSQIIILSIYYICPTGSQSYLWY
jgi:hypothetical protein